MFPFFLRFIHLSSQYLMLTQENSASPAVSHAAMLEAFFIPPRGEVWRGSWAVFDDAKVLLIKSPIPRNVLSRHELASYCELFIHRLSQIRILGGLSQIFIYPQISTDRYFKLDYHRFLSADVFCPQIITDSHAQPPSAVGSYLV